MLIKFNQFRSFYSIEQRDKFNEDSHIKPVVCINPSHIVAVEEKSVQCYDTYPSSYNACEIYTLKGKWSVEGSLGAVLAAINNYNDNSNK
jgi:hypothetical protein